MLVVFTPIAYIIKFGVYMLGKIKGRGREKSVINPDGYRRA